MLVGTQDRHEVGVTTPGVGRLGHPGTNTQQPNPQCCSAPSTPSIHPGGYAAVLLCSGLLHLLLPSLRTRIHTSLCLCLPLSAAFSVCCRTYLALQKASSTIANATLIHCFTSSPGLPGVAEPHFLHYTPIHALSVQYLGGVNTAAPHSWRGKEHLEIKNSIVGFQVVYPHPPFNPPPSNPDNN